MMGDRAIYHDGWILSNKVGPRPWENTAPPLNLAATQWELYDLRSDWTQADDIAAKHPDKVKQLKAVFDQEAKKYQVLPLDNSLVARAIIPKPSITAGRDVFTWTAPLAGTPNGDAPSLLNTSYNIKAEIEVPQGGAEGMLMTQGGRFGGYGFYLLKGKPKFVWNLVGLKNVQWKAPEALSAGKHTLEFDFKYEGMGATTVAFGSYTGIGQGGTGVLKVDGQDVATRRWSTGSHSFCSSTRASTSAPTL